MNNYIILFSLSLILNLPKLLAQETSSEQNKIFTSWEIGYLMSSIKNDNYKTDVTLDTKNKATLNAGLQVYFPVKESVFFLTGIRYTKYSILQTCNGYFKSLLQQPDLDGYYCFSLIEADFQKKHTISTVSIPVGIRKNFTKLNNGCSYFEGGIMVNYTYNAYIEGSGEYEKKGIYPSQYINLYYVLEDVYRLGYVKTDVIDEYITTNKTVTPNFFIALGHQITSLNQLKISFKAYFTNSIFDITKNELKEESYYSITGDRENYKKTKLSAYGLILAIKL